MHCQNNADVMLCPHFADLAFCGPLFGRRVSKLQRYGKMSSHCARITVEPAFNTQVIHQFAQPTCHYCIISHRRRIIKKTHHDLPPKQCCLHVMTGYIKLKC